MHNSFTNLYFLVVLLMVLSSGTIHSQTTSPYPGTSAGVNRYPKNEKITGRIKWTWQLPASVKKAFDESLYKNWFIENIIICDNSGKIFYRFCLDNGSLLDGDHHDSFLKNAYLDVSESGAIIRNQTPY